MEEEEGGEEEEEESSAEEAVECARTVRVQTVVKHASRKVPMATPDRAEAGNPRRIMRRLI